MEDDGVQRDLVANVLLFVRESVGKSARPALPGRSSLSFALLFFANRTTVLSIRLATSIERSSSFLRSERDTRTLVNIRSASCALCIFQRNVLSTENSSFVLVRLFKTCCRGHVVCERMSVNRCWCIWENRTKFDVRLESFSKNAIRPRELYERI